MTRVESNNNAGAAPGQSGTVTDTQQPVEVVIVTGLSGAGRGTAARVLEDLGWYVTDNLPPELIGRMIELGAAADPPIRRLALVMDVRSRFFTIGVSRIVDTLLGVTVGVVVAAVTISRTDRQHLPTSFA